MMNFVTNVRSIVTSIAALAAIGFMSSCSDDDTVATSKAYTSYGEVVKVGDGTGKSWVQIGDDGNPKSIGFTLSEKAMDSLPKNPFPPTSYFLPLPSVAKSTGYDHISLDWNSLGHEPTGTYDLPHFDAHFYHIDTNARNLILPLDSLKGKKVPDADNMPAGYIFPGPLTAAAIVPKMGVHYIDPASHEHNGSKFDQTMIFGFWDGQMIFTEPMITREYLLSKPNFSSNLAQPKKYPKTGVYYATKYSIRYEAGTKEYVVSLDGLTKR